MLAAALIMGFAGSLHCAGMCSPLALAVTNMKSKAFANRILYNAGRISMYGLLGALFASIGYIFPINNFQTALSLGLGLVMIVLAVLGMTDVKVPFVAATMARVTAALKNVFSRFLTKKNPAAMIVLGSINGLLPCGLTFLALSFCVTLHSPLSGFAYMFTFGLGTLPVMLGLISILNVVTMKLKWDVKTVTTGLMALSGILLIARVFLVHAPEAHGHSPIVDIVICR
ncbi:MAG TPA: sulfite exporter TauE/SafE family protein [Chryseosolibacter sp.]